MPKQDDKIEVEGVIEECLPNATFKVRITDKNLPEGLIVIATVSGRLKKYSIRVIIGDSVLVELSPYDPNKGRIVFRNSSSNSVPKKEIEGVVEECLPDSTFKVKVSGKNLSRDFILVATLGKKRKISSIVEGDKVFLKVKPNNKEGEILSKKS